MESAGQPQFRAEDMPGSTFHIYTMGTDFGTEAAAFTGTQRRRPAGFMDIQPSGKIGTIFVKKEFRGKGIAGRMHEAAGSPPHSEELTDMGNAWRKKTGGEQPEQRGEARVKAEPLNEKVHEQQILPLVANEIKEFGKLKSRGESFHGSG
jgi:hypothetical protein